MAKTKKKRAAKYDRPYLIKEQFGEVIKGMTNPDEPKEKAVTKKK